MKKKKPFLKNTYKMSWQTIKDAKWFIYSIIAIFLTFFLIGYFFPNFFVEEIMQMIEEMISEFIGIGIFETIIKIFFNNLVASFFAIIFGIIFGIFPIFAAMLNGYIVGFVANHVVKEKGLLVLWRLLPHGIFELPAIFISMGLGVWLGFSLFQEKKKLKEKIINGLKTFVTIVIPLLIIAAIIEGILIGLEI